MSEYVTVEVEYTNNPTVADLFVNQILTHEDEEVYSSPQEGEVGSPVAQMLFTAVDGILQLTITEDCLTITRADDYTWEMIIDEVRDALRDWYL
jgi:hypothetical protein